MKKTRATFWTGQTIVWPKAPGGTAQIEDLRRTRVAILYRRDRRICRAIVKAETIHRIQRFHQLLPGIAGPPDNLLNRGIIRRSKTFEFNQQEQLI